MVNTLLFKGLLIIFTTSYFVFGKTAFADTRKTSDQSTLNFAASSPPTDQKIQSEIYFFF
jgi:hypothetical protein